MTRIRLTFPVQGSADAVHVEADGSTKDEAVHNARIALADELGRTFVPQADLRTADIEVLD